MSLFPKELRVERAKKIDSLPLYGQANEPELCFVLECVESGTGLCFKHSVCGD